MSDEPRHRPREVQPQSPFDDVEMVKLGADELVHGRAYASVDAAIAEVSSVLRAALPAVDPVEFGGYERIARRVCARLGYDAGERATVYADDQDDAIARDQAERAWWLSYLREQAQPAIAPAAFTGSGWVLAACLVVSGLIVVAVVLLVAVMS